MRLRFPASILLFLSFFPAFAQTPKTCSGLKSTSIPAAAIGLPTAGGSVDSAKLVHSGTMTFCKVLGQLKSVDPVADPIHFEVNLPIASAWNGKAVHFGGGAFDGTLAVSNGLHQPDVAIKSDPTPLQRGYATFGGDSGHNHHYLLLPDIYNSVKADFALNDEQRLNFNHDGLKKTRDAAVFVMKAFYGSAPKRMFFLGGSTGGREAYFVTQRWPDDYDGVLGAFAGWNQVQLDLQLIRVSQAEYRPGNGQTRGWLPSAKTKLVAGRVMQACDALDGVKDGILSDPADCRFDLKTLACPAGKDRKDCLTPGQLQSFEIFNTEQRTAHPLARGVQSIPGYNVTSGADLTGTLGLLRHPFHPPIVLLNSFSYLIGDGVLRFFLTRDPHFNALTFDTTTGGSFADGLMEQSLASDASDADLRPFFRHGGKFIMLHGTTDTVIPTGASVEFYRMMQGKMPQTALDESVRFFLIPGYGHGRGVFDAGFDALGVLDRWVESGAPPDRLTVTDNNKAQHGRTRPLCGWPTYPRYVSGDPNLAASFTCDGPKHR